MHIHNTYIQTHTYKHNNSQYPNRRETEEKKSYAPSSNDVIYRGHLKPGTSVSRIVTPRLQQDNEVSAPLKQD